jgi:hypothetical protein
MNDSSLVKFNIDDNYVLVRDTPNKEESAKLLNELINRMYALKNYVVDNIDEYPDYRLYIEQFDRNFTKNRTKIYETSLNSEYTSYSTWYAEVKRTSGVYPATFMDFTSKLKPMMIEMWENKITPRLAILELRKHGVY